MAPRLCPGRVNATSRSRVAVAGRGRWRRRAASRRPPGLGQPGDVERGAGVQDHGVSARARLAVDHRTDHRRVVPRRRRRRGRLAMPARRRSSRGSTVESVTCPSRTSATRFVADRGQLVQPAGAVDDHRVLGAQPASTCAIGSTSSGEYTPEQLALRARRVGQRAEHVEDRADAELAADRPDVAHGRVVGRREQEAEADLVDAAATSSGARSMRTPSASSTSAVPQRDDTARLPCLATARRPRPRPAPPPSRC